MRAATLEFLESRRVLAYTFAEELIQLPIDNRSGIAMEVADFNADGRIDLVVATSSATIDVLLGESNKSFSLRNTISTNGPIIDLIEADLNGDELADYLVHTSDGIIPLVDGGSAEGKWLGFELGSTLEQNKVFRLEQGEFNGDAFADIAYLVENDLIVRQGNGDGSFGDAFTWRLAAASFHDFDVGDINGDSFDDFVVTSASFEFGLGGAGLGPLGPMTILTNDQSGTFSDALAEEAVGISVELFDYDRDGQLDVLAGTANSDAENSVVFNGTGAGEFRFESTLIVGRFRVGDGRGRHVYTIQERTGHGTQITGGLFINEPDRTIGAGPWRAGIEPRFADLNQDGIQEVIGISENMLAVVSDSAPTLLATGEMTIPSPSMWKAGSGFMGDFDDDGYEDLIWYLDNNEFPKLAAQWGSPSGLEEIKEVNLGLDLGKMHVARQPGLFAAIDHDANGLSEIRLSAFVPRSGQQSTLVIASDVERRFIASVDANLNARSQCSSEVLGDIDNDGVVDRVRSLGDYSGAVFTVQRGLEHGGFDNTGLKYGIAKRPHESGGQDGNLHLADVTGDGALDLLYYDQHAPHITVLPGVSLYMPGDLNRDDQVNLADLELLLLLTQSPIAAANSDLRLDLTGDQEVDKNDLDHWVTVIANTRHGDLNLDGKVDFADFLRLSANFGNDAATWSEGEITGDASVNFDDFLLLSSNFGYEASGPSD